MQGTQPNIFEKLPAGIFRPLGSANQKLYWKILVRLYQSYFDEDIQVADTQGHTRSAIVSSIAAVIDQNAALWVDETEDVVIDSRQRANATYYALRDSGWLDESRYGYADFVTMAPWVAHLMSVLLEISEGRALIMTGKLKSLRSAMREIELDPGNTADLLVEATKDAKRFARHLSGIRGSFKALYDQIKGNIPAREIVASFFDDFLSDILVRDYTSIKTSENPLAIRDDLLRIVSTLRSKDESKGLLAKGYQRLFPKDSLDVAAGYLNQDLSHLESVFLHIEHQLDAIDSMRLLYEQRVDAVIAYASKTPPALSNNIRRLINAVSRHGVDNDGLMLEIPIVHQERIGQERFPRPRKPKTPPAPRALRRNQVSPEEQQRSARERFARMQTSVSSEMVADFLDRQMGSNRTFESKELVAENLQDYFCLLKLQRAAYMPTAQQEDFSGLLDFYHVTLTDEWAETQYTFTRNLILTRRERT